MVKRWTEIYYSPHENSKTENEQKDTFGELISLIFVYELLYEPKQKWELVLPILCKTSFTISFDN